MTAADKKAIEQTALSIGIEIKTTRHQQLRDMIIERINHLLENDFTGLVNILYRIDVNEHTLRSLLAEKTGTDAAVIIYDLILERQIKKIQSRQDSQSRDDISESDKW